MVKLMAIYTKPDDPAAFDKWYREAHLPLAWKMKGLKRVELSRIVGSPRGEPRYYLIAELYFDTMEELKAASSSPEGIAAGKDAVMQAGKLLHMMVAEVEENKPPR